LGQARLAKNILLVKRGLVVINEVETCPAWLGKGNMLWGVGWVRLG